MNTKKLLEYSIFARIFVALMFTIMVGFIIKSFILFPNELLFDNVMEYTSSRYSSNGRSGWTYNFYVLNQDGLFVRVFVLLPILFATVFYFGVLSAISIFYNLKSKRTKEAGRDTKLVLLIAFPFLVMPNYYSFSQLFDINERGGYLVQDRILTPDNKILEIGTRKLRGHYIENNSTVSNDSSFLLVRLINENNDEEIFRDKIGVASQNTMNFLCGDTLWLFQEKAQYLKALSMRSKKVLIEDKNGLLEMMPEGLNTGISELSHSPARKKSIYIHTDDGRKLYLHTDINTVSESYRYKSNNTVKYYLRAENKHRFVLNSNEVQVPVNWRNEILLDAEIINYKDDTIIIRHRKKVNRDAKFLITAYSISDAKKIWEYSEEESPLLEKVYGKIKVKALINKGETILNLYDTYSLKGTVLVDAQGKQTTINGTLDALRL
ncbi:hypothetical protein FUAX_18250 [Fulvitalea axinellae]|uniref:Uncharacterized protein n=1 Tax=Fulvitalea axinellae TaxID=1182444 RepID=A0AAU9CMY6_9BACT|nr:hypothetical protein FUAX_18250 [Fulvitalea axinellae]